MLPLEKKRDDYNVEYVVTLNHIIERVWYVLRVSISMNLICKCYFSIGHLIYIYIIIYIHINIPYIFLTKKII